MTQRTVNVWAGMVVAGVLATSAAGQVRVARLFTDHAVLQQKTSAPIWGWATPGETVRVRTPWNGEGAEAVADARGRWQARLDTPAADGTPFSITVSGSSTVTISDVVLGEVWVCSGQSNMEWPLSRSEDGDAAIAQADHPLIRVLQVDNRVAARPRTDVDSQHGWRACTPATAGGVSAVAYYFARDVQKALGVPVGIIQADWGGTPVQAWTSGEVIAGFSEYAQDLRVVEAMDPDPNVRAARMAAFGSSWWDRLDTHRAGPGKAWAAADFDDASWDDVQLPALFAGALASHDGAAYFRRSFDWAGGAGEATISLGPVDDRDDVYVNGVHVGGIREDGRWNSARQYTIPAGVLRAGRNVVGVRVVDTAGPGGFHGTPDQMRVAAGGTGVSLAGAWKARRGPAMSDLPPIGQGATISQSTASTLFNGMVHPLIPTAIGGFLWYQGESNRNDPALYARVFPAMIEDWRGRWGRGDLPFYFVQIAPFDYPGDQGQTALLREAQASALALPHTGMVVTLDVGDERDIHPIKKREVGERLARVALADTYGVSGVVAHAPRFSGATFESGAATVRFDLGPSAGVRMAEGPSGDFALAGADRVFCVAEAQVIAPGEVRVRSARVPAPVAVRYGFDTSPAGTLRSAEGLPVAPFRSDGWETPPEGWAPAEDLGATPYLTTEAGFTPLFDGSTLDGWVNVNTAPSTWRVERGMIRCSGVPTGVLRTTTMYENFVLELEWRHLRAQGNAGLFVWSDALTARGVPFTRSVEVQVMTGSEGEWWTSDGDIFPIHGATMTPLTPRPKGGNRAFPTEKRMRPSPQWNHYRVECVNGEISLAVNGKVVTRGKDISPRKGFICLESEGTPIDFRNIRIKELPPASKPLAPEMVADASEGFVPLYNGVDFSGWKFEPVHEGHFTARDWTIAYDGRGADLWSARAYRDFVLIADWRWSGPPADTLRPVILPSGEEQKDADGKSVMETVKDAGDSGIYLRGSSKSQVNMWCWGIGSGEVYGYRTDASLPADVRAGVTPRRKADRPIGEWNRFVITMKGDRLTVVLNGETVIENALLPGVAREGPIALQSHGSPIEFANILIKELE
ncbi:MAG: family 16 glycoside hydrolase [Planctomycetota bacterium]|nr:family 16 glycoside hydrolase [Planctomycetota bacterium]